MTRWHVDDDPLLITINNAVEQFRDNPVVATFNEVRPQVFHKRKEVFAARFLCTDLPIMLGKSEKLQLRVFRQFIYRVKDMF